MLYEWYPDYVHLRESIAFLGSVFTRIWSVICSPFILENRFTWGGGYLAPRYSYLLPVIAFGITFSVIMLLKKLISALVGGV